jgi:hypothetical protein
MAEWKKVIVSGSDAELNNLEVTANVTASFFTGSFVGDGSALTGLDVAINSYTNPADNRLITSVDGTTVNAESNLLFDGSSLGVTGSLSVSGETILGASSIDSTTINGTTINVPNIAAGTDNSVVVYNGSSLVTDEIDSRVWDTNLVNADGTLTTSRIPYANDSYQLTDSTNLTFDGTTLTANYGAITNDLTVGGNLYVNGDLTNINTANLNIEDQFILLASGSVGAVDSGIIFGGVTSGTSGASLFYDSFTSRLSYTPSGIDSATTAAEASGYVTIAYDISGGQTAEDKIGNMKIDTGDIFIYV